MERKTRAAIEWLKHMEDIRFMVANGGNPAVIMDFVAYGSRLSGLFYMDSELPDMLFGSVELLGGDLREGRNTSFKMRQFQETIQELLGMTSEGFAEAMTEHSLAIIKGESLMKLADKLHRLRVGLKEKQYINDEHKDRWQDEIAEIEAELGRREKLLHV